MTSFRPRPIDIDKPLCIIRDELKDEETRSMPALSTGMEHHEENESHIREAIEEAQRKSTRIVANIPTPIVRTIPTYDRDTEKWDQPSSYIKVVPPVHPIFRDSITDQIEYDLDSDDEHWIAREINKNGIHLLSDIEFELLIDTFEKALAREIILFTSSSKAPKKTTAESLSLETAMESVKELPRVFPSQLVETVYHYWLDKRNKKKGPLLLSLVPPPAFDDPSPLVPFRPREKEYKKKTHRRKNSEVVIQLRLLKDELERGKDLLDLIQKREIMKKEKYLADAQLFEARVVQKQRQIERLRAEGRTDKRSKPFSFCESSDEDVESMEDEESDQVMEEVEIETSNNPHSEWDRYPPHYHNEENNPDDEMFWGTIRLPGVPPFRGRTRMGRGGRIFIDRASTTQPNIGIQRLLLY